MSETELTDRPWRCHRTGNPVGTDTEMIGAPPCDCQGHRAADALASRDATIAELRTGWEYDAQCWREVEAHLTHRAEAAEARCAELDRIIRADLHIDDAELLRVRNKCEGVDGDVKIWSRMLQMIVDAVREARALSASPNREGRDA